MKNLYKFFLQVIVVTFRGAENEISFRLLIIGMRRDRIDSYTFTSQRPPLRLLLYNFMDNLFFFVDREHFTFNLVNVLFRIRRQKSLSNFRSLIAVCRNIIKVIDWILHP